GNVVEEIDQTGAVTRRTFDARDHLTSETDPLGNTTRYTYDAQDNLTSEVDPLGNATRHTYDAGGRVLATTDALGRVAANAYDAKGNLLSATDAAGNATLYAYDTSGNLLSTTDAAGAVTRFAYDARGNQTREVDALGNETAMTYDGWGRMLTRVRSRSLDGLTEQLVTANGYDDLGRLVAVTHPDGSVVRTVYDAVGQEVEQIDALGRHTATSYDAHGRVTAVTYPDGTRLVNDYDADGQMIRQTDRAGRATTHAYDPAGRRISTTFADGATESREYDAAGRLVASTDAVGAKTTYAYDAAGRQVSTTDALGRTVTTELDATGQRVATVDAAGRRTTYEHDALGNVLRTVFPDGSAIAARYDATGRPVAETDEAGRTTAYEYDLAGELTAVLDPLGQRTSYGYDEVGNRTSQTDANGHTTSFAYDAMGRMTGRTLPDGSTETLRYDLAGNLVSRTSFGGDTVVYERDENDRVRARRYSDGSTVWFTYTAAGERAAVVDRRGITAYRYDARGRLLEVEDPAGRKLGYTYDAAGRRTALTATVGSESFATSYGYDEVGRLTAVTDASGGVYTLGYDAAGNRTALEYPNGVTTSYAYDAQDRLLELGTSAAAGEVLQRYAFTLDPTGKRIAIAEGDGTARSFTYDALDRLTGETMRDALGTLVYEHRFTYDPVGNRREQAKTVADGTTQTNAYTYDSRDRLLEVDRAPWSWNVDGQLISQAGDAAASYQWDFDGRLVKATLADGTVVEHDYDADGNRVTTWLTVPGGPTTETHYLVDPAGELSHVVAELDAAGNPTARYVRASDELLAVVRGGETRYAHADGIGSIRALTGESGAVTDRYAYSAFGEPLSHDGADPQPYRFAGEPLDPSSGFAYHRARWMDPAAGRFASMGPWRGRSDDPGSLHRYTYAANDPVLVVDPTGQYGLISTIQAARIYQTLSAIVIGSYHRVLFTVLMSPYIVQRLGTIADCVSVSAEALQFLDSATEAWLRNADDIPPGPCPRGCKVEDLANPNIGGKFEVIDNLRGGTGTSVKSYVRKDTKSLIDAIRGDVRKMVGIENRELRGPDRYGTKQVIPKGTIQTKAFLVGISQDDAFILRDSVFKKTLRELSRTYRTYIRLVPVRRLRR
ncbi:MAG: RHS repeat-associated core domain-containing protein, partial [Candidatus Schekmanbacteria bacterium]|nr:RHS repeat-associated core domain-containing protein [Candidatus Schekmanbacteria bacterium]